MRRALIFLILINISLILFSQNPDLGLNGVVTWVDSTHIRVEYDWSSDVQLLDWTPSAGSTLTRSDGIVKITDGDVNVASMVWKQLIKCSRIYAQNAKAISSGRHLNIITNAIDWNGTNYLPDQIIGLIHNLWGGTWLENGTENIIDGIPYLDINQAYTVDLNISDSIMTFKSSIDNVLYSHNLSTAPVKDRQVAIGGYGGSTEWGKVTIEGEVNIPWKSQPISSDVINIQSNGATFAPVIEVIGTPAVEWVFDDSTTSASLTPVKDYGSAGSRHNYLKVTPWSSLIGINVGYDAGDGGYGDFVMVDNQHVLGFQNLNLAKSSLQYLCASYSPITELDLREFTALKFIELLYCQNLATLRLDTHPVLERVCVEDCNLDSLNLSGCPALKDLRGALNSYTSINWGSTGQSIWHICVRDNPQFTVNIPPLAQFPLLMELLIWNGNQTGPFVCNSSVIQRIDSYNNHYTSADISGCTNLSQFSLSGSKLASLDFGTAYSLTYVQLMDCSLTESQIDYVLHTLDVAGQSDGYLELTGNAAPSAEGIVHYNNLIGRGWTISISQGMPTGINENKEKTEPLKITVTVHEIKILLNDEYISWNAGLYNLQGRLVLSKTMKSDVFIFDISSLSPGIYIVVLSKGVNRKVVKVIKP